jgi:hypothetical protein
MSEVVAQNKKYPTLTEFAQMLTTFLFVSTASVIFRNPSLSTSFQIIKKIVSDLLLNPFQWLGIYTHYTIILCVVSVIFIDWRFRHNERSLYMPKNKILRRSLYIISIISVLSQLGEKVTFIYFQF